MEIIFYDIKVVPNIPNFYKIKDYLSFILYFSYRKGTWHCCSLCCNFGCSLWLFAVMFGVGIGEAACPSYMGGRLAALPSNIP